MGEHPLRSLLSRIIRGSTTAPVVELSYIHRGAPGDQVHIRVSAITRLRKGSFTLPDGETEIPYHRVLTVMNIETGETLWKRREGVKIPSRDP